MWASIKEIYFSVKNSSNERIRSPFYGVFILTWIVFNWEGISILIFSNIKMPERINLINSSYPFGFFYPLLISAVLATTLPFINEKFTSWQSKPISRTSILMAVRKKRALIADISVERFRAKRDVTYDRFKAGAEKDIQTMREDILLSRKNMGDLTAEKDNLQSEIFELNKLLKTSKNELEQTQRSSIEYELLAKKYRDQSIELQKYFQKMIDIFEKKSSTPPYNSTEHLHAIRDIIADYYSNKLNE